MKMNSVVMILLQCFFIMQLQAQEKIDLLIVNKNYDNALQLINDQLKDNPEVSLFLKKGSILNAQHDYQAAVLAFNAGLDMEPDNLQLVTEMADAYAALGNHHDASAYFEKAVIIDPGNLLLAGKLGRNYIQLNNYKKAYQVLNEVFHRDSSKVIWNKQLAYCAYQTGKMTEAVNLYEKVLEMNPGDYASYMNLIKIYQHLDQDNNKLTIVEKGLKQFPNDAAFLQVKAFHQFYLRNYEAASKAFEEYFVAGGDSAYRPLLNYGICLYFTGNAEKSITMLDGCVNQVANDPYALFYLALAYKKLVHYDVAEAYMNAAIESATPAYLPEMYHHLGQIYGQQRMFEESIAALKKANELDPTDYEVLFEIATTYEEFNANKTLALNYYNVYLREAGESAQNAAYALERMSRIKEDLFFEQ